MPLATTAEQIDALLTGEAARLTRNSLISKERFLYKQAETFCALLADMVAAADSERQRLIFVTLFKFTPLTKRICSTIVKKLNSENQVWFIKWWIETWNSGSDSRFEINIGTVVETRKWLLSNLNLAVKGGSTFPNEVIFLAIRTLVASEFFKITKRSKSCTVEEFKVARMDISPEAGADLLFTMQNLINTDQSPLLADTIAFIHHCMAQKGIELVIEFDQTCQDTWGRMQAMSAVTREHKYAKILTPLVHQCALSIFTDRKEDGTMLLADILDLVDNGSCDDASLVEILLSFFVTETSKNRHMVVNCFRQMASDCTERAITVIADAIDPSNKDGPLDIEDDEDNEEDDEEDEEEDGDDREAEKAESDDDDSDSDEEDEVVDESMEELKQKLKIAMGEAVDDAEDESDLEDMTDEQMMSIDDAIGGAFKSMVSGFNLINIDLIHYF